MSNKPNLDWTLGGEPPEPAVWAEAEPVDPDKVAPSASHTGTDPAGRAVGPNEDHTTRKPVKRAAKKTTARKRS